MDWRVAFILFLLHLAPTSCTDVSWIFAGNRTNQSFCQSEHLRIKCSNNQVIFIEMAKYGRMQLSRCARGEFGYLECWADVTTILDEHCSGRRSCVVKVLDENFQNLRPCHDDLKSYLEVAHTCLPVVTPSSTGTCTINSYQHNTHLTSLGFISSLISMESNCGFSETPWKILLQLGQKINFTLVDFSTETSQKAKVTAGGLSLPYHTTNVPHLVQTLTTTTMTLTKVLHTSQASSKLSKQQQYQPLQLQHQQQQQQKQQLPNNRQQSQRKCKALYAIIKDLALSSKLVNVCGGGGLSAIASDSRRFIFRGGGGSGDSVTVNQSVVPVGRIKHIAVTNGNEAEVMFSQDILIAGYHFLIVFEAIGCIEMDEPDGAWIKQDKTSAIIGCHGTHVTWLMTCTRGLWVGETQNCSAGARRIFADVSSSLHSYLLLPLEMSLPIILTLAVLIGVSVLFIGIVCMRKFQHTYAAPSTLATASPKMATFTMTSQKNKCRKDKRRKFDCFSTKISSCHKPQARKACSNSQTVEKNHINIFPPPPITPTNYWHFSSSLPLPSNQNETLAKLKNTTTNNNNSQSNCTYDPENNKQLQQQHPPQCLCLMSPMLHQTSDNLMKCCCSNSITNLERTIFLRCDSPQLCRMASQPAAGEMEHVENSNIFDQSLITDAGNVSSVFINSRSRTNGVLSLKSDCDSGERMINRNVIESEELASINASDGNMLPNNNNNNSNNNIIKNNNLLNENALSADFNVDVINNNSNNNINDAQSFCRHSDFPFFLDVQINNNNPTNNIKVNKDHRKDKTNTLGKEKHSKQNRYQTHHHHQQQQQQQQQPHLDQQHDHQRCNDNAATTFLSLDPVSYLHADYKKLV